MRNIDVFAMAEEVVKSFVEDEKTFTIWDVTKAIRNIVGRDEKIFHDVVRHIVQDGADYDNWMDNYNSISGDFFDKGSVRVFHYFAVDPMDYIKQRRIELGLDSDEVDDDDFDMESCNGDCDNCPQNDDLANLNDEVCDCDCNCDNCVVSDGYSDVVVVDIDVDDEIAEVDETANDFDDEIIIKTVDSQNRIRFTKHILESAGFTAGDKCNVTFSGGCVIVTCVTNSALTSSTHTIDEYTNLRVSLNPAKYTADTYIITVPQVGIVVAAPNSIFDQD